MTESCAPFDALIARTAQLTEEESARLEAHLAGDQLVKTTIGTVGEPHPDGGPWNVAAARRRAWELLDAMAAGTDLNAARRAHADGPTLREAQEFHIQRMERGENRRRKACSPRSIATTRGSVELHLAEYLDRPLVDLTADAITSVMEQIEGKTARRGGSNPANGCRGDWYR